MKKLKNTLLLFILTISSAVFSQEMFLKSNLEGLTTGISAKDRAVTIRTAIKPNVKKNEYEKIKKYFTAAYVDNFISSVFSRNDS